MSISFPTSLDSLPNPIGTDLLENATLALDHDQQHSNANDAIEALEAKVGINSSAVTTSHDYKLSAVTSSAKALTSGTSTQSVTGLTLVSPTLSLTSDATGDIYYRNSGGALTRLPIGTTGQILDVSASGIPEWIANPSAADASTTTKGVVELATQAEVNAGTTTGGTGANLVAQVSTLAPTGTVSMFAGSSAPSFWLMCDGSAVSRSTYATLFGVISTTYGSGDGSTTFNLPNLRGRSVIGVGAGTKVATFASRSSNVITVTGLTNAANNEFQTGQAVTYVTSGSVITGLTSSTVYYIIRVTNTTFSLATSLANAIAGTVISLSSDGSGTQTFTQTLTTRALGDTGGEENHAIILDEVPTTLLKTAGTTMDRGLNSPTVPTTANNTTGDKAHNIMTPFVALNYIIKI